MKQWLERKSYPRRKALMVYSGKDMNRIEVYDMQGRLNGTRDLSGRTQVELDLPHFNGMDSGEDSLC